MGICHLCQYTEGPDKVADSLKLELQEVVSCLMLVLGPELNLGHLEKHQEILTTHQSFQLEYVFFKHK